MRYKQPFSIYKRKRSNGKNYFYYHAYDEDGKRFSVSTGETSKARATEEAMKRWKEGTLVPARTRRISMIFSEFAEPFFVWGKCPIVTDRIARGGKYSQAFCRTNKNNLNKHILPTFGKMRIDRITPAQINRWLLTLPDSVLSDTNDKPLSKATCNKQLTVLRQILEEAVNRNLIKENPAKKVKQFVVTNKSYDSFTVEEMKKIFDDPNRFGNELAYNASLLASMTGMRRGEIFGLQREDIFPDKICIRHGYSTTEGLKSTKSGHDREVPITKKIYVQIISLAPDSGYVFSIDNGKSPVGENIITKTLQSRICAALEISEEQRRERGLTFHSWRHFFNTRLVASGIQGAVTRAVIGHEDEKMTNHYLHLKADDIRMVTDLQKSLLA